MKIIPSCTLLLTYTTSPITLTDGLERLLTAGVKDLPAFPVVLAAEAGLPFPVP